MNSDELNMETCMLPIFNISLQDMIKIYPKKRKVKFLPLNACAQKYIRISVNIPSPIIIANEDESLHQALNILGHSLKGIYSTYWKNYHFFEPIITYRPSELCFTLNIGIYKKKDWHELNKRRKMNKLMN